MASTKKPAKRNSKTAVRSSQQGKKAKPKPQDALALLKADHQHVSALFDTYEKARGNKRKEQIAHEICSELKVHMAIEEELFYPALRAVKGTADNLDEANVEHAGAKHLIGEIENSFPGEDYYDAKLQVLSEYIRHHVKEEQEEIFPKARKSRIDLYALGDQLWLRKQELQGSLMGLVPGPGG